MATVRPSILRIRLAEWIEFACVRPRNIHKCGKAEIREVIGGWGEWGVVREWVFGWGGRMSRPERISTSVNGRMSVCLSVFERSGWDFSTAQWVCVRISQHMLLLVYDWIMCVLCVYICPSPIPIRHTPNDLATAALRLLCMFVFVAGECARTWEMLYNGT